MFYYVEGMKETDETEMARYPSLSSDTCNLRVYQIYVRSMRNTPRVKVTPARVIPDLVVCRLGIS